MRTVQFYAVILALALPVPFVSSINAQSAKPAAAGAKKLPPEPAPDCRARVGYDRDMVLPGYILPTSAGPRTCIPFTTALVKRPADYKGDFYVDEFTDEKLRQRWEDCKRDRACYDRVYKQVMSRHPPNHEQTISDPHARFLLGKIEEHGEKTDLSQIRRPSYFGREPYQEPIAQADTRTYIVEFTAPPDTYERLHQNASENIKLRGWYIKGDGVANDKGSRTHALIIISGGGGDRVTAIDDPRDRGYAIDPKTGETLPNDNFPNATTGVKGMAAWRKLAYTMNQAGFDVLEFDRRGVGISEGYSETNTLQQGHDLLKIVADLRTGDGLRALTPAGEILHGSEAAETIHGGKPNAGRPTFFLGSSRGTMASSWAMTQNFDKDCSYDMPTITCKPPVEDHTIKGAILLADFSSGVGYLPAETTPKDDGRGPGRDRGLFIGGIEVEHNIVFFPSSATLAGIHKWPSAFFARGLWCYADGLEGEIDSYTRVNGLKELIVVRGPHAYETWPEEERVRVRGRIIAYATAVVLSHRSIPGGRMWSNMKELVATTGDIWESSTRPTQVPEK